MNQHNNPLDHHRILKLRLDGLTWEEVAGAIGHDKPKTLSSAHNAWKKRNREEAQEAARTPTETAYDDNPMDRYTRVVTGDELPGLHSIEDLALFFDVDPEIWQVKDFRATGNTWPTKAKGEKPYINHQYKISASFERRPSSLEPVLEEAFDAVLGDLTSLDLPAPVVDHRQRPLFAGRHLAMIGIHDAHFGMLSWAPETDEDYDLAIAESDYVSAGKNLADIAEAGYGPERFLYVAGHDLMHIDGMLEGKIPVTNRGTPQDLDSRLPKIFRTVVRSVVEVAVHAAAYAPVDIVIVRGNHDKHVSFYIGEVLAAAFENHPRITVRNEPRDLVFYSYGANTLGLTHGEKILRKQNNLAMIFADECPPEMWISSHRGLRELLTGHFHKRMEGGYFPRGTADEERGITTIALPGLTATDAWHKEEGYRHRRAATLRIYDYEGRVAGAHEHTP